MRAHRNARPSRPAAIAALLLGAAVPALPISEREQRDRLLFMTRENEAQFAAAGLLYGDAALDAYLQGVIDRLYPEARDTLHVRAYRSSEFNAFAVATGSLYFNIGTFLRLDDESQLAAVLGHEGGHVVHDHMYRGIQSAKANLTLGRILSMGIVAGIGIDPGVGAMIGYSSMAGFSRDMEREADRAAYERMTAAGYDGHAGAAVFERMSRELTTRKIKQGPYFFADHPRIRERVEAFAELARNAPPATDNGRQRFLDATLKARLDALDLIWKRGDAATLIFLLDAEKRLETLPAWCRFYLAEGYRLRGSPGDPERAIAELEQTTRDAPDYSGSWNALGRLYLREGRKPEALQSFRHYLDMDPNGRDAGYARQYVAQLEKETPP